MGENIVPARINLTGQTINNIKFISFSHVNKKSNIWNCICHCGNNFKSDNYSIKVNKTKSCGCIKKKNLINLSIKNRKWKYSKDKIIHSLWRNIISRCYNKNNCRYKDYGGRGIKIYFKWKTNYDIFYLWVISNLGNRPSKQFSLDRIDNNGNYVPGNLRWGNSSTQNTNSRAAKLTSIEVLEIRKSKLSRKKLAEKYKVSIYTISNIIKNRTWKNI